MKIIIAVLALLLIGTILWTIKTLSLTRRPDNFGAKLQTP